MMTRRLFAIMMNATMMERLLRRDLDNASESIVSQNANRPRVAASEKIDVVLRTEEGFLELEVCRGESVLVRLIRCARNIDHVLVIRKR